MSALVRASHPEPTVAVTAVAMGLAVSLGRDGAGVAAVAVAVLSGQLSIGWLNDAVDAARDSLTGRADKPIATRAISRRTVTAATVVAALVCVPVSLASGVLAGTTHLLAVASGWAYNLGVKSTPFSVVPYALAFGLLPTFVVLGLPGSPPPPWWLPVAGALLGAGAHFANVLPDLADDAVTGVRGLPHRLGATGSRMAAGVLLLAASVVLAAAAPVAVFVALCVPVLAAVVLTTGFLAGRRDGSRAPFRAVLVVAVVDVALLLTAGHAVVA
ncbi:UbiA family prenyltransferase [Saccharomonospora viridis]|uniref:4-hydroxybenzoate polyprenyltransferase-like prenyltransferase n=1 Tax=Saccharomonospora viridis (strain ATCC 15386 / DSM 43017 / JCM 3036 / CCUG 5913 / NBRC 12207 / NCIMB 9602 / P101) TaxID=471857 RepID=C7MVV5_SACVD|nr:4-hydroxybenzoate polyprenyltransferase-like prenyltransferase [Saccharomonospora viridis DSM 43017]